MDKELSGAIVAMAFAVAVILLMIIIRLFEAWMLRINDVIAE